jgi:hypothetical protein
MKGLVDNFGFDAARAQPARDELTFPELADLRDLNPILELVRFGRGHAYSHPGLTTLRINGFL